MHKKPNSNEALDTDIDADVEAGLDEIDPDCLLVEPDDDETPDSRGVDWDFLEGLKNAILKRRAAALEREARRVNVNSRCVDNTRPRPGKVSGPAKRTKAGRLKAWGEGCKLDRDGA